MKPPEEVVFRAGADLVSHDIGELSEGDVVEQIAPMEVRTTKKNSPLWRVRR